MLARVQIDSRNPPDWTLEDPRDAGKRVVGRGSASPTGRGTITRRSCRGATGRCAASACRTSRRGWGPTTSCTSPSASRRIIVTAAGAAAASEGRHRRPGHPFVVALLAGATSTRPQPLCDVIRSRRERVSRRRPRDVHTARPTGTYLRRTGAFGIAAVRWRVEERRSWLVAFACSSASLRISGV